MPTQVKEVWDFTYEEALRAAHRTVYDAHPAKPDLELRDLAVFDQYVRSLCHWAQIDHWFHEGVQQLERRRHDATFRAEPMDVGRIYRMSEQMDPRQMHASATSLIEADLEERAEYLQEQANLAELELELIERFRTMWSSFGEPDARFAGPPSKPGPSSRAGLEYFCARLLNVGVRKTAAWRLAYTCGLTKVDDPKRFLRWMDTWAPKKSSDDERAKARTASDAAVKPPTGK